MPARRGRRPKDQFRAYIAFDPSSRRSHIEFDGSASISQVSYRLTAAAYPHPGQGFARDDIGITSSGFVVLDLAEIIRRVFEAEQEAREAL